MNYEISIALAEISWLIKNPGVDVKIFLAD